VLLHVPEEMELRLRGADDEHLTGSLDGSGHLPEEPVFVVGMISHAQIPLVGMAMEVGTGRMNERVLNGLAVNFQDACPFFIDPYECVLHDDFLERVAFIFATSVHGTCHVSGASTARLQLLRRKSMKNRNIIVNDRACAGLPMRRRTSGGSHNASSLGGS